MITEIKEIGLKLDTSKTRQMAKYQGRRQIRKTYVHPIIPSFSIVLSIVIGVSVGVGQFNHASASSVAAEIAIVEIVVPSIDPLELANTVANLYPIDHSGIIEQARLEAVAQQNDVPTSIIELMYADGVVPEAPVELVEEAPPAPVLRKTYSLPEITYVTDPIIYESIPMPTDHQIWVNEMAAKYNLPLVALYSQIWRESSFTAIIKSATNDYGYAQINKSNFKWMEEAIGATDLENNPYENLEAQAYIMRHILDTYKPDNWHTWLMQYNMGPSNARKCWADGKYSSQYSRDIVDYASTNFGVTDIEIYY